MQRKISSLWLALAAGAPPPVVDGGAAPVEVVTAVADEPLPTAAELSRWANLPEAERQQVEIEFYGTTLPKVENAGPDLQLKQKHRIRKRKQV